MVRLEQQKRRRGEVKEQLESLRAERDALRASLAVLQVRGTPIVAAPVVRENRMDDFPVNTEFLKQYPEIVGVLPQGWLYANTGSLSEIFASDAAGAKTWKPKTKKSIDLTSRGADEALHARVEAAKLGLVTVPADIERACSAVLHAYHTGGGGAVGATRARNMTKRHQHAAGVLHCVVEGSKIAFFWPPSLSLGDTRKAAAERIELRPGQIVWIPPGWWHEFITDEPPIAHEAAHGAASIMYTTWCVPQHMLGIACAHVLALRVKEDQSSDQREQICAAQAQVFYSRLLFSSMSE